MKTACVFALFAIYLHLTSFSQNKGIAVWQNQFREINAKAAKQSLFNPHSPLKLNTLPPGDKLSVKQISDPASLKKYLNSKTAKTPAARIQNRRPVKRPQVSDLCVDTSFNRLLNTYASWIFVERLIPTADGGFLIPALMYDTTMANFTWRSFGLLLRIDADGNVVWIKQFDNTDPGLFSTLFMYNAFELPNTDIICVGTIDTSSTGTTSSSTIVYRLDKNGNVIWQNALHTTLVNTYPIISIDIRSAAEGLNGDLILCGTTDSYGGSEKAETIIRLDNSGNTVWDANYGNNGDYLFGAEGMAVYVQNGKILEVGLSHGTGNPLIPAAVNFLTLDYNTGNILSKRFFRPSYADESEQFNKTFTYYSNKCTRLANGHFVINGQLFSDYINATSEIDHFGVIEFDEALNLVNAYTISSDLHTNYNSDILEINKEGKGLLSLVEYKSDYSSNVYFGAFENKQFLNQRKAEYNNIGLPGNRGCGYTNDNGYVFAQSYFAGGNNSFIDFRKMHNSDTSSLCLGKDTFFLKFLPLHIIEDPGYIYLDANINEKINAVHYNLIQTDTIKVLTTDPCKQANYCDTIKIHGNPLICGGQLSVVFTAYKNPSCGGIVQWNIEPVAIDSMEVQNDSSVLVHFRNQNWEGKLYVALPAGKCYITAMDSLDLIVTKLQAAIDLGIDTILCKGNTMILHAGNAFKSYQWNDGSIDSVVTIAKPGKYYITAKDNCGNIFSDTIIVAAANFPFSIGNDTLRCNSDTIHLTATGGFINYKWLTQYNISSLTGQSVTVLPKTDTLYIATAEKWPGCMVTDTVKIKAYTSPSIYLGNDTSLCLGQSLVLDAGTGFSSYTWSNGTGNQQATVSQKGLYFVKATAPNSCNSYDTLQVLNISPLPVFTLGTDTTLCAGTIYSYNFNLQNASYLWNDGSAGNQYNINQAGMYYLAVTRQGCTGRDTVIIDYKNNPVADLGKDTTLCAANSYLLDARFSNATYEWQDGSTLPDFSVNAAGKYFVAVDLNGCVAKDTVVIAYLDKPQFTLGSDTAICDGQSIFLQPRMNVPVNYMWQDGSTQSAFTIKTPGLYSLKATNICGSTFDEVKITAGACGLMLPNAFTPNGDGLNDIFRVKYPFTVQRFRLTIFNRFGQKIFETTDINKGWDGSYQNQKQPVGSYVWVVQLVGVDSLEQTSKGLITLIN
ncbi:MAG: gliding motility-associated C-terminal domain-containing protein [Ginsengibacter sp.]